MTLCHLFLVLSTFGLQDDLQGLDIENGQCVNSSVPQNVEFGYQNLPFDSESDAAVSSILTGWSMLVLAGVALLAGETMW